MFSICLDRDGSAQNFTRAESAIREACSAAEASEDVNREEQLDDVIIGVFRWQQQ